MASHTCPQCGAVYLESGDSCAERFSRLLALDHSRQEPWGSRHGSAFSAYTLQHPAGFPRDALMQCWTLLYRTWIAGDDPQFVTRTLREVNRGADPGWQVPPLPLDADQPRHPRLTIADLGSFEASTYPEQLEAWCRATLESLGQPAEGA